MPVISFVSSKGGVGKTTGAVILAGELAEAGRSVVMVDADPNQPLLIWKKVRAVPPAISIVADESADTIIDTIDAARGRADFVIVDLEGTATDRVGFAVTRTDLVLIPVQASVLDATEAAKAVKLVRQMSRVTGRDIPYRLYFSKTRRPSASAPRGTSRNSSPKLVSPPCRPLWSTALLSAHSSASVARCTCWITLTSAG